MISDKTEGVKNSILIFEENKQTNKQTNKWNNLSRKNRADENPNDGDLSIEHKNMILNNILWMNRVLTVCSRVECDVKCCKQHEPDRPAVSQDQWSLQRKVQNKLNNVMKLQLRECFEATTCTCIYSVQSCNANYNGNQYFVSHLKRFLKLTLTWTKVSSCSNVLSK